MIKINKKFLIASHRGYRTGNIIENTFLSFKSAVILGADIVEIDISKSKDGKIYVFHDGSEKRLLLKDENILNLESSEIEMLNYYNSIGEETDYKVEDLDSFLQKTIELKKDYNFYINIDRAWNYLEETLYILNKYDLLDIVIIKTPMEYKYLNILKNNRKQYMFLALLKNESDVEKLEKYEYLNIIGYEYSGVYKGNINNNNKYCLKWANSLKLNNKKRLFDEYNDDNSILNNGYGWGKLLNLGFNVIQTDHVSLLNKFREELE